MSKLKYYEKKDLIEKTIKNSIKPNSSIFLKAIKLNKSVLQYIYII